MAFWQLFPAAFLTDFAETAQGRPLSAPPAPLAPWGHAAPGAAPAPALAVTSTALGSDSDTWGLLADWLIVSRRQDHIVETADGALHMVLNRGVGRGLELLTSRDGGASWDVGAPLPDSTPQSTADIRLIAGTDVMMMTYVNGQGQVAFAVAGYDPVSGLWEGLRNVVVDPTPRDSRSTHPTGVMGPNGALFVAYTEEIEGGLVLVQARSVDQGLTWARDEIVLEGVSAGAARMVVMPDGTRGIILATPDTTTWVQVSQTGAWTADLLDDVGALDHFASHYSVVEAGDDIVMARAGTDFNLRVTRYDGSEGGWQDSVLPLGATGSVFNVQISRSSDTGALYISLDDTGHPGRILVLESRDTGLTWARHAVLQTPEGMVTDPNRFEAPEVFSGDLVIGVQVHLSGSDLLNGMYFHSVDVDGDGPDPLPVLAPALPAADDFLF